MVLWVKVVANQIALGCAVFMGFRGGGRGGGIVTPRAFLSILQKDLGITTKTHIHHISGILGPLLES